MGHLARLRCTAAEQPLLGSPAEKAVACSVRVAVTD